MCAAQGLHGGVISQIAGQVGFGLDRGRMLEGGAGGSRGAFAVPDRGRVRVAARTAFPVLCQRRREVGVGGVGFVGPVQTGNGLRGCKASFSGRREEDKAVKFRCRSRVTACSAFWRVGSDDSELSEDDDAPSPSPRSRFEILRSWLVKLQEADWSRIIFGLPSKEELPWTVPWSGETIFQVMFLWFAAFWLVGSWVIPIAAQAVGCNKDSLTYRGQALYSLITDVAEGSVGLIILQRCLSKFYPLPGDWFPISWRGKWYVEACLGCFMFPLVNRLSQLNLSLLPFPTPYASSQVEQSITARDPVATLLYAIVVSVCAPVWEEVIFRGFLLPSLTKYLPVWASVIVSSVAFALAHFSAQRLFPLTFLGLVMGIIFVRSRNLLASMLLHSLWNGFVFLDLLR